MGAALAFKVAIALGPASVRVLSWAQGPAVDTATRIGRASWARLNDPAEADETLAALLSGEIGYSVQVTTFSTTFETRKLQAIFGRASGGAVPEDSAVCTFHFLKLTAGAPASAWVEADFTALETAFDAMWGSIKVKYYETTKLKQLRWYRAGPQRDEELGAPGRTGPPVRVVDRNVAGTVAASWPLPPQVAVSVTEMTTDPKAWGRFYLPAPAVLVLDLSGRLEVSNQTLIGNAADTFYESALTNGTPAVVYSSLKSSRLTKAGLTLPAKAARALTVDKLQVDDLLDVIRSRRWASPLLRLQRQVGA